MTDLKLSVEKSISPMNDKLTEKLISYCVEKVTKGVKKQIKGYVNSIQAEIEWSRARIVSLVRDFNFLLEKTQYIRKDFEAIDLMIKETTEQKKLLAEMKILHGELRNKFMDFELLVIELQQKKIIQESKNE